MRPTPANIAYLQANLKGFMIDSLNTWYDSPVMNKFEKTYNRNENIPGSNPSPDLEHTILQLQLNDAIEKFEELKKGAE
jgi:hypothetical protein